jgi:hypothetical protein
MVNGALSLFAVALIALTAAPFAHGEVTEAGGVRVSVQAGLAPTRLPREGEAPISISIGGKITPASTAAIPQLQTISVALNAHGRLQTRGMPSCRLDEIEPSTTRGALAACRGALIGEGQFSADVELPAQSPFPAAGTVLAFNGTYRGRRAILAHIYGRKPAPTSYVLPFLIAATKGTYGTILEASLPTVTGEWGFVTGISMTLGRSFVAHGQRQSYLSAGCPAPKGFPGAVFPLARTTFDFEGGPSLSSVSNRNCQVAGE